MSCPRGIAAAVAAKTMPPAWFLNADNSSSSGEGYSELGKVYKDPKTGKLIMIEN